MKILIYILKCSSKLHRIMFRIQLLYLFLFNAYGYYSQRTSTNELTIHSFEMECPAVIYTVKLFHVHLYGVYFNVITDCDSLRLSLNIWDIIPWISRCALFLQNYDFDIFRCTHIKIQHFDAFSGCHAILVIESNTFKQTLVVRQSTDEEEMIKIKNRLQTNHNKFYELRNAKSIIFSF